MSIGFIDERPDEVGFIDDEYGSDYTPDSDAIPRAAVAAALRELRHRLDVALDEPLQWPDPTKHNRCRAIVEVDATIAKLGLTEETR